MHIHVSGDGGEAKFWMLPAVALAKNSGLSQIQLREAQKIIEDRCDEIRTAWTKHFAG